MNIKNTTNKYNMVERDAFIFYPPGEEPCEVCNGKFRLHMPERGAAGLPFHTLCKKHYKYVCDLYDHQTAAFWLRVEGITQPSRQIPRMVELMRQYADLFGSSIGMHRLLTELDRAKENKQ